MAYPSNKALDQTVKQSDSEVSKNQSHNGHLNLLDLTRYVGKGFVEGAAKPIEGLAQVVTGKKLISTDENAKLSGVNAAAEHFGQYGGEAFDYILATKLGHGVLGQAEKRFGFDAAKSLGPRGSYFAEKAISLAAGGVTGFLQPTRDGGLDLSHRGKNAFLGATSTGLFEGSSMILSKSGASGSVLKDGAKVFMASFVAGGASTELQSRVNYKQDASLKDIATAGLMWGVTGTALHGVGKGFSQESFGAKPQAAEHATSPEPHTKASAADATNKFIAEMPSEMAKTIAEASAFRKHDEPVVKEAHRSLRNA